MPSGPIAQVVDGLANVFTAAICTAANNRPAEVCSSAASGRHLAAALPRAYCDANGTEPADLTAFEMS